MTDLHNNNKTLANAFSRRWQTIAQRIALILVGTFIGSISINAFYIPRQILAGGVTGIATLLNLKFGFNISLVVLLLNIPIFIIGYKFIFKEFLIYSLIGMVSLSFFLQLTSSFTYGGDNLLTTILFGGVVNGIGFGLVLRANASTGGADIISKVLNMKLSYSIATMNFAFNIVIIGLSAFVFNLDIAVETLTAMYISATTINFIIEGTNYKRTVFIITSKPKEVAYDINRHMKRGCTIIEGEGSYTNEKRDILYAVISVTQVAKLKLIVRNIDDSAFINVMETRAVFGNGFLDIHEE